MKFVNVASREHINLRDSPAIEIYFIYQDSFILPYV